MHRSVGRPAGFGETHRIRFRSSQKLHCGRKAILSRAGKRGSKEKAGKGSGQPLYVTLEADGSDLWRLDPIIKMLQEGAVTCYCHTLSFSACDLYFSFSKGVQSAADVVFVQHYIHLLIWCMQMGILPTDSYPALVCDVDAKKAVERLYQAKEMSPSKQLSILCKNFSDIQTYTLGFPTTSSGQDTFRIAKRVLPGPVSPPHWTFCLERSRKLPCSSDQATLRMLNKVLPEPASFDIDACATALFVLDLKVVPTCPRYMQPT